MNRLLSIVLPVYNREAYVIRTLESICASTYRPVELIIVDNGSTDGSLQLCEEWAADHRCEDFEVQVLQEEKRGANSARNRGLAACKGDYVAFFDSDDLFCSDALTDVAKAVEEEEADLLFLPVEEWVEGQARRRTYRKSSKPQVHILNSMLSTASMIFRTQWLRELGGWDESLSIWQDWELGVRVLLHRPRIHWLCERVYHQNMVHAASITGSSFSEHVMEIIAAMRRAVEDVERDPQLSERERSGCRKALYFRAAIMAGKLRQEGNAEGAAAFRKVAETVIPHPLKNVKMTGLMLENYTALGGRGAWRLALALV